MSATIPGPDDDGLAYGFTRADSSRIRDVVRRVEGYYKNRQPQRGRWPTGGGGGWIPADSGAGLAAGSRSSPTSATVTLLVPSGSDGGMTTGTVTVTAYNNFSAAIAGSKTIWISQAFGKYYVVQVDC